MRERPPGGGLFVTQKMERQVHTDCNVRCYLRAEILGWIVTERSFSADQRCLVVLW